MRSGHPAGPLRRLTGILFGVEGVANRPIVGASTALPAARPSLDHRLPRHASLSGSGLILTYLVVLAIEA